MRYCGVAVSPREAGQLLVTLHERRGLDDLELVASFYEPGTVPDVVRTVQGFGRGEAVVAVDAPSGTPGRGCERALRERGLPIFSVPGGAPPPAWQAWLRAATAVFEGFAPLGRYLPEDPEVAGSGAVGTHPLRHGRVFETYPDAIFCALLGHRPSPRRTPWGLQQRIAALKLKGIVDEDGGLWHRTVDELDACAAAYAAYAFTAGLGTWFGDPAEGVVVLPVGNVRDRYDALPPPARVRLA